MVDGEAACPCVLASKGNVAQDFDLEFKSLIRISSFFIYISLASLSNTA